ASTLVRHAAACLAVAFTLSLVYEFYRAALKPGVSEFDSMQIFLMEGLPFYAIGGGMIGLLLSGWRRAPAIGLVFSALMILLSVIYYNPYMIVARQPRTFDWFEDIVYTGLLFVAAALLLYDVRGNTLRGRRTA